MGQINLAQGVKGFRSLQRTLPARLFNREGATSDVPQLQAKCLTDSQARPGTHFFRVGSWSIDGDAGTECCSRDLREGISDADGGEARRPEFEIEGTVVGFAVRGNRIFFVDGEDV